MDTGLQKASYSPLQEAFEESLCISLHDPEGACLLTLVSPYPPPGLFQ